MLLIIEEIVITAIVAVIVPIFMVWVAASARQSPRTAGDAVVLEHTLPTKAVAWTAWSLFSFALAVAIFEALGGSPWIYVWVASGLFVLATLFFMETRCQVTLDAGGIHDYKMWRGNRSMTWSEITSVRYVLGMDWLVIKGSGGRIFRILRYMRGVDSLRRFCEEYVEPDVYGGVFRKLDR